LESLIDRTAIGIDERTAVLADNHGLAEVVGAGSAYFLNSKEAPSVCKRRVPLSFAGVRVRKLRAGERFRLIR
jgi:cyanophycinase-like exopeptidase